MAQVWMRLEALAQQHGVMDQLQVFVAVRPRKPAHGLCLFWQRVRLMRHCGWCSSINNSGGARLAGNEMCSVLTDFGQHRATTRTLHLQEWARTSQPLPNTDEHSICFCS